MAGTFSTALNLELIDHIFMTGAFVAPTALWISLYSVAPTAAGGGTEITGNGYARIQYENWDIASSTGITANAAAITFAAVTGSDWPSAVAFGIHSLITGGVFYAWGDLTTPKTATVGDTIEFAIGELDVSLT